MKYTFKIKKNRDLKYILKKGKYFASKYLVVHFINNKLENNKNGFAVCVSKKNGNSVHRNKMKRWAREVYKEEEEKLIKGINILILFKKTTSIDILDYNIVKNNVIKCFEELKLYEERK